MTSTTKQPAPKPLTAKQLERFCNIEEGISIAEQCRLMGAHEEGTAYRYLIRCVEAFTGFPVVERNHQGGRAIYRCELTPAGRELRRRLRWHRTVKREADAQLAEFLESIRNKRD